MIAASHPLIRSHLSRYSASAIFASTQHIVETVFTNDRTTPTMIRNQQRQFGSRATIGPDPLEVLRKESAARKKCDEEGRRLKTTDHWALSIAMAPSEKNVVR